MIAEDTFTREFEKLTAAFSKSITRDQRDQWFIEFEYCEQEYFVDAMKRLRGGDKFPTWAMLWATYRPLVPLAKRAEFVKSCGVCKNGKIFYRALNSKTGEVHDLVGCCLKCAPDMPGLGKVNPDWLHKDKIGVYRLPEALKADRRPTQVKWPAFLIGNWKNKRPGKECPIPENPPNLAPQNDPDFESVVVEVRKPDVKMLVQEIAGGKDDPEQEGLRQEKLKEDKERDLAGVHN